MNNNPFQNVFQNQIIQIFSFKSVQLYIFWIGKTLISVAWGNKNITSTESTCWLNIAEQQAKEFLFFSGFLSVIPILLFCLSFSCTSLEGNNKTGKTKTWPFLTITTMQAKIFLLFLWKSPFHSPSLVLSLMLPTQ